MLDITPLVPEGSHVIERYGDRSFTVLGKRYEGSILLFPDELVPLSCDVLEELSEASLERMWERQADIEILLVGTGKQFESLPSALRTVFRARGLSPEVMDTGAACRTYNILLSEGRNVAAILL